MGRENKKEAVAELHREKIIKAAEALFFRQGFEKTTVDHISKASGYSRRTVYAYFESKDDILHHIIEKGLISLKQDIETALHKNSDFLVRFRDIFASFVRYQTECPYSFDGVAKADSDSFELGALSDTARRILSLGDSINSLLSSLIEDGKKEGAVRRDVNTGMTVYILWSSLSSLITLAKTKGGHICRQFAVTEDEFLEYGFRQTANSILEVRL